MTDGERRVPPATTLPKGLLIQSGSSLLVLLLREKDRTFPMVLTVVPGRHRAHGPRPVLPRRCSPRAGTTARGRDVHSSKSRCQAALC